MDRAYRSHPIEIVDESIVSLRNMGLWKLTLQSVFILNYAVLQKYFRSYEQCSVFKYTGSKMLYPGLKGTIIVKVMVHGGKILDASFQRIIFQ